MKTRQPLMAVLARPWAVGLGAGRAGQLRGAARQTLGGSVGRIRPPRVTDGSDCCATPVLHREMEAAPRVSTAPRGHWRRRRPRPSPGNPGQGGGVAPAPLRWSRVGAAEGINGPGRRGPRREGCAEGETQHRGSSTRPVHNKLKPVPLLCAGKGLRQAFLATDKQRMTGGKYIRSS